MRNPAPARTFPIPDSNFHTRNLESGPWSLSFTVALLAMVLFLPSGCGRGEAAGKDDTTAPVRRDKFVVWVSARGKVTAESNVTIAPPRWWQLKVSKLVAKEGDKVEKGDVLVELDTENLEDRVRDASRDIRSAEGALQSAQAGLGSERDRLAAAVNKAAEEVAKAKAACEELKHLPLETDLRNAEIDRDTARKTCEQAKIRFENMKQLYEKGGGVSLQQLEQREMEYRSAVAQEKRTVLLYQLTADGATQAQLREAQIKLELAELDRKQAERTRDLTIQENEEIVKKAEGTLAQNQGNLARVQHVIDACIIHAPLAGTVFYGNIWTPEGMTKLKEGMEVHPWDKLMELPDTTRMQIKVEVEERDIGSVEPGQPARIALDAYPDKPFSGKVTRIEPVTKRKGGRVLGMAESEREDLGTKVIEVVLTFAHEDPLIRTGLNGRSEIRTGSQAEGLVIPLKALFSVKGRDVVYLAKGGTLVETPVKVGGRSDTEVLILEGVQEGDRVSLVSPTRPEGVGSGEEPK